MEYSSKWNPHIIKIEPSYYQKEYWRKSGINESDLVVLQLPLVKWN